MPERASGFCVYDDPAVAIAWLLATGAQRVAYVDVDVHHGDGPQAIFWNDPRVLTVSLHEYEPPFFFPGTGGMQERGGPEAPGSCDQCAVAPRHRRRRMARGAPSDRAAGGHRVRSRRARDAAGLRHPSHRSARRAAAHHPRLPRGAAVLHELAHSAAGGRWVATGGGGYRWAQRRTAGVDARVRRDGRCRGGPARRTARPTWVEHAAARAGEPVPTAFSEPSLPMHAADDEAARVVAAVSDIVWG